LGVVVENPNNSIKNSYSLAYLDITGNKTELEMPVELW
jgi:hypothetical protein